MSKGVNHDVRKRMVVIKAMRLFAQMGYQKVSFATISDATGIARTALYRYFKTKRDLFDEAIHEITSSIMMELRDIISRDNPVNKRLELVCDQVVEEFFDKKDFFLAIFDFVFSMVRLGEDMSGRIALFTDGLKLVFRKLISEGVRLREISPEVDPDNASEILFSQMESVAFKVLLGVEKSPEASRRRFSGIISTICQK